MNLIAKHVLLTLAGFGFFFVVISPSAGAISAQDFTPGKIIDDGVFYNKSALGGAQGVQNFLNTHVPACDTWGTGPSGYGSLTRAQYAQQMGWHAPPYACLQNYHENPATGETSFEKGGGAFDGGQSAAQIIWDASQEYGINPQVLIVMLRKESAGPLTADNWPLKSQYKYAMGYGCPDSGPGYSANCAAAKAGFYNQMRLAAWQLRYYADNINTYNYRPNRTNYIQYNPDPNCGGKNVFIENIATASLYIYTPYVPNDGALNAYPGQASCGAYGNRNFFMMFNEWFGSTYFTPGSCDTRIPNVTCVWELIKPNGDYFYTSSITERDASLRNGMGYSKVAFYARPHGAGAYSSSTPTYRLQQSGNHFWTSSEQTRQQYLASGWTSEGISWFTDPVSSNTGSPIYKLRSPNNKSMYVGYGDYSRYIQRGYVDENDRVNSPTKVVETSPAPNSRLNVYRLLTCNNEYLFTTSILEVEAILTASCARFEGVSYNATSDNASGAIPVSRLYNNGRYIWTTSQAEASALTSRGWQSEGIAYYINSDNGTPVIRLSLNGRYIWTTSQTEASTLSRAGWTYEGIVFYAPGSAPSGVAVSRFNYNGRYIWTTSQAEAINLSAGGWKYEGIAYYAGKNSSDGLAVNRLYNNGRYIWTTLQAEASNLSNRGWTLEGVAYYAASDSANGGAAVNRFHNNGRYIWTTSQAEASGLIAGGWSNEGVAYYAKP